MLHFNKLYKNKKDTITFSCNDIRSQIHKLANKNSSGPDGIPNILKKKFIRRIM